MIQQIVHLISPISSIPQIIGDFFSQEFFFDVNDVTSVLTAYLSHLSSDLWVFVEFPYVDRVYRDSYYTYFASKHRDYSRDSVRLSFFQERIEESQFRNPYSFGELESYFVGTLVIRPTMPRPFGRAMISPRALRNNRFYCCLCRSTSVVNGVRLSCYAFPHASQDGETLSCAETSVWSSMEYFGHRYPEYALVPPSRIIEVLSQSSFKRLLPSEGLTIQQISLTLKDFGFGTVVYSQQAYRDSLLHRILNHYVESGIPVIVALQNDSVGHAVVYIGHTIQDDPPRTRDVNFRQLGDGSSNIRIKDLGDASYQYVVIDDNYPPYQVASCRKPAAYYTDPRFDDMKIAGIVVPLYKRVYLDAYKAHNLVEAVLSDPSIGYEAASISAPQEIVMRFFLTSSRSFKYRTSANRTMSPTLKELIIRSTMPKFIWVAELTDEGRYALPEPQAFGYIILDATSYPSVDAVFLIVYPGCVIHRDEKLEMKRIEIDLGDFDIYRNNLKGGWSKWAEA